MALRSLRFKAISGTATVMAIIMKKKQYSTDLVEIADDLACLATVLRVLQVLEPPLDEIAHVGRLEPPPFVVAVYL